ncbi:hypothetical protein [Streptosporangium sandarakinum]|uniref:hypothetical protein n=1 Tax=Streptosporangium sandarakinum TaxID=1260955 RepID=UPI0036D055D7
MSKARTGVFSARAPLVPPCLAGMLLVLAAPAAAGPVPGSPAVRIATVALRADTLTITVPGSVDLGSGPAGGSISASMGTVTVADNRGGTPSWTATVAATDFTTGSGTPAQTITKGNVAYWSGQVTTSSGTASRTAGQPTADQQVALSSPVTAFSSRKLVGIPTSTSWAPTLVVTIPSAAAPGVYTGVVTHSVA